MSSTRPEDAVHALKQLSCDTCQDRRGSSMHPCRRVNVKQWSSGCQDGLSLTQVRVPCTLMWAVCPLESMHCVHVWAAMALNCIVGSSLSVCRRHCTSSKSRAAAWNSASLLEVISGLTTCLGECYKALAFRPINVCACCFFVSDHCNVACVQQLHSLVWLLHTLQPAVQPQYEQLWQCPAVSTRLTCNCFLLFFTQIS